MNLHLTVDPAQAPGSVINLAPKRNRRAKQSKKEVSIRDQPLVRTGTPADISGQGSVLGAWQDEPEPEPARKRGKVQSPPILV